MNATVQQLLDTAALPFERARAMPPDVYTSDDFLALEQEHIFSREWICVGRESALPNKGDYLTTQLVDQPIVVLRDDNNALRAYSNVCLHRFSTLLSGTGRCQKVVCPYHGWTYDLQGQLLGGPQMSRSPDFAPKDYRLPEVRLAVWQGWIYITLSNDAEPVAAKLASLYEKIEHYGVDNYVETFREEHLWDTNWKILAENFMESYHLPMLHRENRRRPFKNQRHGLPTG